MEAVGSGAGERNDNRVSQTLWYDYKGTQPRQAFSHLMSAGSTMFDGFHTYPVEWDPGVNVGSSTAAVTYTRSRTDIAWIDSRFSRRYKHPAQHAGRRRSRGTPLPGVDRQAPETRLNRPALYQDSSIG